MRKYYLPPTIKQFLQRPQENHELQGSGTRRHVMIGKQRMVIPDTYEKEKWQSNKKEEQEKKQRQQQAAAKKLLNMSKKKQSTDLTPEDKRKLKFSRMFKTIDELKSRHKDFDRYVSFVLR